MPKQPLISSREAAERLGVKVETLYAYVSRGLIKAHHVQGLRGSRFHPGDVDTLAQRGRRATKRSPLAVESAITRIDDGSFAYRGHDPLTLLGQFRFENVAALLWDVEDWQLADPWMPRSVAARSAADALALLPAAASPLQSITVASAVVAAHDELRADLSPASVRTTASRMIASIVTALGVASGATAVDMTMAARLAAATGAESTKAALAALDAALILLADHELAASTMAARTAAAFRADPHAVVAAGLGALAGAWHGGASGAAEKLLREVLSGVSVERAVADRVSGGGRVPGLGQFLYPLGDPRAPALFAAARRAAPGSAVHGVIDELLIVCDERGYPPPNVDLGLAALSVGLDLVQGSGEAIFAVARMAGWVAHAMEEYASPSDLRPRAVYVGRR
ncbi:MAG: citrate synthase [Acidimicrobiales bacterium]|nr:citrate synthase [Acidimicrobiales bacterium]